QRIRHNASNPLNWARDRRILSQGAMSSRRVVITRIRFYESAQVLLTQCDAMVNALAPDRPNQQRPGTAAQSQTRRAMPQCDAELMAKEQVLGFKLAPRLEQVDAEHCERMQEREHRPRSCGDSTRRCDSQAGWDFRKGQGRKRHARQGRATTRVTGSGGSRSVRSSMRDVMRLCSNCVQSRR